MAKRGTPTAEGHTERALRAEAAGDFAQARRLYAELAGGEVDGAAAQAARAAYGRLGYDPHVLGYGSAAVLVYLVAWALALRA